MRHFYTLVVCVLSSFSFAGDGAGKPSDPDAVAMWIDDLGRLTPFGRTFDVYIQTGFDPDFSVHLVGQLRVTSSKIVDLTTFTLGWKTAKSVLTTGR